MGNERMAIHDQVALPIVREYFETRGWRCERMGTELDAPSLYTVLAQASGRAALMMRFRPDLILAKDHSIVCEVKCEYGGSSNFAIEADSYAASASWDVATQGQAFFAFVDLSKDSLGSYVVVYQGVRTRYQQNGIIKACRVSDVPEPRRIFVPERWDFTDQWRRVGESWPGVERKPIEYKGGSGTPFFLVSKNARYLVPMAWTLVERPQQLVLSL